MRPRDVRLVAPDHRVGSVPLHEQSGIIPPYVPQTLGHPVPEIVAQGGDDFIAHAD